jgi:hypothetical protein
LPSFVAFVQYFTRLHQIAAFSLQFDAKYDFISVIGLSGRVLLDMGLKGSVPLLFHLMRSVMPETAKLLSGIQ